MCDYDVFFTGFYMLVATEADYVVKKNFRRLV